MPLNQIARIVAANQPPAPVGDKRQSSRLPSMRIGGKRLDCHLYSVAPAPARPSVGGRDPQGPSRPCSRPLARLVLLRRRSGGFSPRLPPKRSRLPAKGERDFQPVFGPGRVHERSRAEAERGHSARVLSPWGFSARVRVRLGLQTRTRTPEPVFSPWPSLLAPPSPPAKDHAPPPRAPPQTWSAR